MRTTTAAVWRLTSSTDVMGPPTVALPKYDSSWKDGGVGDRVKSCQRRLAFVHDTGRVDLDGFPEDRRVVWWKLGRVLQNVFERQIIVPGE